MSNRITGPNSSDPQKNQPLNTQAERDRAKRVEKVEKIDPDEETRNRRKERFRAMMEESDDPPLPTSSKPPSPIDLFASGSNKKSLGNLEDTKLPSPSSSPPPSLDPSLDEDESPEEDLPHSHEFWKKVDLSEEPVPSKFDLQEKEKESAPSSFKKKAAPEKEKSKKEISKAFKAGSTNNKNPPFYSPSHEKIELSSKKEQNSDEVELKTKKTPSGRYWDIEQKKENPPTPFTSEKEESPPLKPDKKVGQKKKALEDDDEIDTEKEAPSSSKISKKHPNSKGMDKKIEHREKDFRPLMQDAPLIAHAPSEIQSNAVQAALQAAPYLSPDTLPLFFQLVGSIMVMTYRSSGINQTEIKLVGSLFENSKFYGSTIEITKFSTAPYSINIRLSGSNEAVTTFNQNLGNLRNAFENGNFNFRIGRLVAEYATDRPVFKRKNQNSKNDPDTGDENTEGQGR